MTSVFGLGKRARDATMFSLMKPAVRIVYYGISMCLVAAGLTNDLHAGEALIIGPEKGITEPGKTSKATTPLLGGSVGKLDSPNPYIGLTPSILPNGRS